MGDTLNKLTMGELLLILSGITAVYIFVKNIITPLVNKWLKVEKNSIGLNELRELPARVTALEENVKHDFKRLNTIDEVNVLMMEALQALIRNRRTGNDVGNLKYIEDKIDGFLVGRVKS